MITYVNASVVGLLAATAYQPIFTEAVSSSTDMAIVILGITALRLFKLHILILIAAALLLAAASI